MRRAILALLFSFAGQAVACCQTDVMQFVAYPPELYNEKLMGDHAWRIFATGEIDAAAGKRLAALVAEKRIPLFSYLYLHSSGGNLVGGMELGRVIRESKLETFVGQIDPTLKYVGSKPGFCYSACATAFLGGEYRYWTNGSVYGVHRFFWNANSSGNADLAQIVSAAVVEYIRSMGVETKIFALASQAGPSEMITPSHETLLALNVVNDGRKPEKWTIESVAGAIYLKGEQETAIGINKFMLVCPAGKPMYLYAIFDAGQNTNEVMTWPVNWLFLDMKQVRIDNRLIQKTVEHGLINLAYAVDPGLLNAISGARTLGVGLQPTTEAAVFNGFNAMPFAGGAAKLSGFSEVCHHSAHKKIENYSALTALTRSMSVGSSSGARELFTRRDTGHVCK